MSPIQLQGIAKYSNGERAENDIELVVVVLDENDCSPVFQFDQMGSVNESSSAGIPQTLPIAMCSMYIIRYQLSYHPVYSVKCVRTLPQHKKNSTIMNSFPEAVVVGAQCSLPHAFVKLRIGVAQHARVECRFSGHVQAPLKGCNTL